MSDQAQQFMVRADFPHALISASQRLLASVLVLDPRAFLDAVNRLTAEAPLAESPAEAVMAWFILKDAVARGAECHHAWFHRRLDRMPCPFRPRPLNAPMAMAPSQVISTLNDWTIQYAWGFDAIHCWPPAIRASAVLRANVDRVWRVEDLAKAVYVSSATLERGFRRVFGATVQQYQSRLRLRRIVEHVRATGVCIEGILLGCGYRSPKGAYQSFRRVTGMSLSDVRRLSDVEYTYLLEGTLALPTVEWRNDPASDFPGPLTPNGGRHRTSWRSEAKVGSGVDREQTVNDFLPNTGQPQVLT